MVSAAPARSDRWLFGPIPDLLLGCGLWYAIALAVLAGPGDAIRQGGALLVMPFLVLALSTPHYGATLLRVYDTREDRSAYHFFAVWATLAVAAAFVAGAYSAWLGSWILTIYITWSPWHYTGQNYGIAVMFLRRRGVELAPVAKRCLYASFLFSYALTFLALHSGGDGSRYAPVALDDAPAFRFLSIGLPQPYTGWLLGAVAVAYGATTVTAAALLLRRARIADLLPAAALVLTQGLWFSIPLLIRKAGLHTGVDPWESSYGSYYFLWIAVGHAVQYVWITTWYARARPGWTGSGRYYAKILLAGAAVWTVPALLFAPGMLGRVSYDAGLGVLVASVVNIHHFILDGAIWKLRQGRVARVLLGPRDATVAAGPAEEAGRHWMRPLVWATGALCVALMAGTTWEREVALRRASEGGDLERARRATERLAFAGQDSAALRHQLGNVLSRRGRNAEAQREYERSLELRPSATTWQALGILHQKTGELSSAKEAYEQAAALGREDEHLFYELGVVSMELGEPAAAADAFERAMALAPERGIHRIMLERARSEAGEVAPSRPEG